MLSQWGAPASYTWRLREGEDLSQAPGAMEIPVTEVGTLQGQQREAGSGGYQALGSCFDM